MKIQVVTISDRASQGVYEDRTGPALVAMLAERLPDAETAHAITPDSAEAIRGALDSAADADIILAAGGTGLGPRDITPETIRDWGEREVPGLAELLRNRSLEQTPMAPLSRSVAVQRGTTLAVALPGSARGALFCAEQLVPLLEHAVSMMAGKGHG